MNTISQRCPKCGNYTKGEVVEDFKRGLTKIAIKGVGKLVEPEVPGVGTLISVTSDITAKKLNNVLYGDATDFEFHCPKCGYTWRNLSQNASENTGFVSLKDVPCITRRNLSQRASENTGFVSLKDVPCIENNLFRTASVGSYNYPSKNFSKDVYRDIEDKYNEQLVTLQEEVVDIATNKSKALEYISGIDDALPSIQDENKIKFNVLQALCCLIYSEGNQKKDMSLCKKGMNIAKKAYHADEEANIIYYCLKSLCIDNDKDNVLAEQRLISEKCHLFDNHCKLFKCKFYAEIRFSSLCETAKALENKNRILDAISIYKLITDLPDNAYKSFGLSVMGRIYAVKGIDEVKGFKCVQEAADLVDYTSEFDANNFFHIEWRNALTNSSWSYYSGDGNTPVDYRKAYKQAMLASNLGSAEAMETVGEIYQYCDQYKDLSAAIKWYKKSAELGCEVAQAKLKELEMILSGNVTSNDTGGEESDTDYSSSEQEYIEEIKCCLEEDEEISPRERRLLEKLRIKLGITEERAKELEESLLAPALTDDEKEYLEEYKECAADGEITAKERRLLDKLRKMLGISEERAKELETL